MAKKINDLFFMRPWAIKEDIFQKMLEIVERHLRGEKLSPEIIAQQINTDKKIKTDYEVINGIARIPVYGIIAKRMNQVRGISSPQGTSIEEIKRDLQAAIEDPAVEKIVLDIDSPGGSVDGMAEFSDFIYSLREIKPIVAFGDGQMASAAYFIGSAASEVYASKSSEVGSIGVYAVINDWSVANHNQGLKTKIIKAGKYKAAGHPDKSMTEEDEQVIQKEVNKYYDLFMQAIIRNRGMTLEEVKNVATGEIWIGEEAVEMGLIDEVMTIEEILGVAGKIKDYKSSIRANALNGLKIENDKPNKEEKDMGQDLTVEKVKAEHKLIADALTAEGKELGLKEGKEAGIKEGKETGIKEGETKGAETARTAEKKRIEDICAAMPKGMEAVALQCIREGKTVEEANQAFLKAFKDASALPPGPDADVNAKKKAPTDETLEDKCKREWESMPKLHEEFASLETYTGFTRAQSKGRVRVGKEQK
jgi:signal peptide peptidase SppA